jgi:hypothetical protein
MPIPLKQSTASQEVPLGYFVDSTDGNTEETGLTIANTDLKLWKAGATTLASKNSGGATHISNGIYYATLDATDTDTLGPLVIYCHVAGALPVRVECLVHPANVYDSLYGADYLQVDDRSGNAIAPASTALSTATWTNAKAAYLDAAITSRSTLTAQQVWEYATRTVTSFGTLVSDIWSAASRTLSAFAFSVTVGTNNDKTGYALTAAYDAAKTAAAPGAQMDLVNAPNATAVTAIQTGIADAVWDEAQAGHVAAGTFGSYLDAAISSVGGGAAPSAAEVADAVWNEAITDHLGAGSTGSALNAAGSAGDPWATPLPGAYGSGTAGNIVGNRIDAAVSTRLATAGYTAPPTAAQVRTEIDANSTKLDVAVGTRLATTGYAAPPTAVAIRQEIDANSTKLDAAVSTRLATTGYTAPDNAGIAAIKATTDTLSAASIADAVWDEAIAGHAGAGTTGAALSAATAPTAAAVADAVWDEAISGHSSAGSAGSALAAAGSSGDPWATALPGAYANGTAGNIIGNRIVGTAGPGPVRFPYTVTNSSTNAPLDGVQVVVTSDSLGETRLASGVTDINGEVVFFLPAGTVYIWSQKAGYSFSNPDEEVVS